MKRAIIDYFVIIFTVLISLTSFQATFEKSKHSNFEYNPDPKDTIRMWDGNNLNGFKFIVRDKSASKENLYKVENGEMIFPTNQVGYFYTPKNYSNFKLHAEWSWFNKEENGNRGILLFIQNPDTVWPECMQVNFKKDNAGDLIAMNGAECKETTGKPKDTALKFFASNEKAPGEWNSCDVIANGDSLMVYVNGKLQNKATHLNYTSGRIGFQLEGKPIKFRNIYLEKF